MNLAYTAACILSLAFSYASAIVLLESTIIFLHFMRYYDAEPIERSVQELQ